MLLLALALSLLNTKKLALEGGIFTSLFLHLLVLHLESIRQPKVCKKRHEPAHAVAN